MFSETTAGMLVVAYRMSEFIKTPYYIYTTPLALFIYYPAVLLLSPSTHFPDTLILYARSGRGLKG